MKNLFRPAVIAAVTMISGPVALAAGDATRGAQVFSPCKICHSLDAGQNRVGPNLHGLFGRKAGTASGYTYSAAMRQSGIVWNEDTLAKYLADPQKDMPGTKMAYPGIADPGRLADLIAYLKTATR